MSGNRPKDSHDSIATSLLLANFSEDEYGKKTNRCISDAIVKGSGGLLIGTVISLVFMRRRLYPAMIGTGFGLGISYRNCEKDLNDI